MRKWWIIGPLILLFLVVLFWPTIKSEWKQRVARYVVETWTHLLRSLLVQQYIWRQEALWTPWLLSMIAQESSGDPKATNPADPSYGLMAITPRLLADYNRIKKKSYTVADMSIPWKNMEVGVWFFDHLWYGYKGDYERAVMAYNAGQGNVEAGRPHLNRVKEYLSLIQPQFT